MKLLLRWPEEHEVKVQEESGSEEAKCLSRMRISLALIRNTEKYKLSGSEKPRQAGRNLREVRSYLIRIGFKIWLKKQSKKTLGFRISALAKMCPVVFLQINKLDKTRIFETEISRRYHFCLGKNIATNFQNRISQGILPDVSAKNL